MLSASRPTPPKELIDRLRADPIRAPELIALAAAEYHAPAARSWLDETTARYSYEGPELARMAT
ncbi:MAG TPA: hypothetical protein VNT22_04660, partial [Baekduia sp.]|nr:hypothetical protein [Baekduia sp.]